MTDSYQDITTALAAYFDGFYDGDVAALKTIFHPNAHLYTAADGPLQDDPMDAVYQRVDNRTPPAANNEKRNDRILAIDMSGPEAALARVQLSIGEKLFTDYLSLLKIDGRWQIISKTYTYVPIALAQEMAQAAE